MRAVLVLSLLGACGRIGFDGAGHAGDARLDDVGTSAYTSVILADHPRFLFQLDETSGTTAIDATGNGFDAQFSTLAGGVYTLGVAGALRDRSTAVQFEGDGNFGPHREAEVELTGAEPVFAGDFTVELLVDPDAAASGGVDNLLFVCEHYLTNGFRTGWHDDLTLHLWTDEGGGASSFRSSATMTPGQWAYVVFVHRGSMGEIWLDGAQIAAMPLDYLAPDSGSQCGFGALHGMPTHGVFDEVAAYDTALSPAQIAAHFAAR